MQSIDLLRGAIMILMALDHMRDFLHSAASLFSPEDLTRTTTVLFLTRWVTHFCAPVFVFTAGAGAFLRGTHVKGKSELSRFLWTRGVWLILLEWTVIHFAFCFCFSYRLTILTVFWSLGWSMILLAALIYLPERVMAGLCLGVILLHNLADGFRAQMLGPVAWLWSVLMRPGMLQVDGHIIVPAYSVVPWAALMGIGYCFGRMFLLNPATRRRLLLRLGFALTAAFIVLRAVNLYGDPSPWKGQHPAVFSLLSFLNCTKYPPSLDFLLMTLGPALVALGWLENVRVKDANPVLVFGRVPFFYFIVHLFAIHLAAMLLAFLRYGSARFLLNPLPSMGGERSLFPTDYGFDLWVCYAAWLVLLLVMYPLCRRFLEWKKVRKQWWVGYL